MRSSHKLPAEWLRVDPNDLPTSPLSSPCYTLVMPSYGKITGTHNGVEGTWLVELDDDGVPTPAFALFLPESLPDVVPVWAIHLKESPDPEQAFTRDEVRKIALLKMRRSMDRLKGRDAGS